MAAAGGDDEGDLDAIISAFMGTGVGACFAVVLVLILYSVLQSFFVLILGGESREDASVEVGGGKSARNPTP